MSSLIGLLFLQGDADIAELPACFVFPVVFLITFGHIVNVYAVNGTFLRPKFCDAVLIRLTKAADSVLQRTCPESRR